MSIDIFIDKVDITAMRKIMSCYEAGGGVIESHDIQRREVRMIAKASTCAKELRQNRHLPDRFGMIISQTLTNSYLVHVTPNERVNSKAVENELLTYFPVARK